MQKHWLDDFDFFFFDFDGLLVNTEQLHYLAYKKMVEEFGYSLSWDFLTYCKYGHKSTEALRDAVYAAIPMLKIKESNWEHIRQKKIFIYEQLIRSNQLQLMSGVKEILTYLKQTKKQSCVVTNSPQNHIEIIKELLPILKEIPFWITRADYQRPKPDPQGYQMGIERFTKNNHRLIGFEDTIKGLAALEKTSIFPVLICDHEHPGLAEIDTHKTMHFSSLLEVLDHPLI
ncbi:MAG: HAD family phosphatase [Chlamydiales bacterium]|nr:HAD family phosphatase [Chlamydiales bacterium]